MADWTIEYYKGSSVDPSTWVSQGEIRSARNKLLKVRLNDADEVTFDLNGEHSDALVLNELTTDIVVKRNAIAVARCRLGQSADSVDGETHKVSFGARSYEELLKRRMMYSGDTALVNTALDQEQIGWNLINSAQSYLGVLPFSRSLGITRGTSQSTGVVRTITYNAYSMVQNNINDTLVAVDSGMDWEITPGLVYKVYYPRGTQKTDIQLSYPGNIKKFTTSFSVSDYTNVEYCQGKDNTISAFLYTSAVSNNTALAGVWDTSLSVPDYTNSTQASVRATHDINVGSQIIPSYSLVYGFNQWPGPSQLWLGDSPLVSLQKGRINVQAYMRIIGLDININDEGSEEVTVYVAKPDAINRVKQKNKDILTRLANIERRSP